MFSLKRLCNAAAVLAITLTVSSTTASAQQIGDGGKIRMMASPFGSQSFIPFVIQKFQLDKKYGFELERISFADAKAANAALQSGSAEFAIQDWNGLALMRNAGVDVIGVAPFITYVTTIVVPTDSKIAGITDLKDKKFGIFSRTSTDWIFVDAAASKKYGMQLSKQAELQEGAPTLLRGALEQGRIDATLMFSSISPEMIAGGKFKEIFTIRDVTKDLGLPLAPYLIVTTTERYAKAKPQNVKAFVAAYKEVYEILMKDDSVWQEQGTNMKLSPGALIVYRDQMRRDLLKSFTPNDADTLKKTFAILKETAGSQPLGMEALPDTMLTLDYQ